MSKRTRERRFPATSTPAEPPSSPWRRRWLMLAGVGAAALVCAGAGAAALVCAVWAVDPEKVPIVYDYEVVNVYPHDPNAYCQGLAFADGVLYEGTGKYGFSSLRKVDLETGQVLKSVSLDTRRFGEGIAVWKDQIIQLTWKGHFGIIYDKESFAQQRRFGYRGEGWGLTHDGRRLIMSNGSTTLRFLDPETFKVVGTLSVRNQGQRIWDLNELEYVNGSILANVWRTDRIACISPRTGEVTAWIDLERLFPSSQRARSENVLNGIAYDSENDRLFVTGKNWPKLYEIRLKPKTGS